MLLFFENILIKSSKTMQCAHEVNSCFYLGNKKKEGRNDVS